MILRLLFVGRNSNPRSFQSVSIWAVPGIPNGLIAAATEREVPLFLVAAVCMAGNGAMKADADANADRISADDNFIFFCKFKVFVETNGN